MVGLGREMLDWWVNSSSPRVATLPSISPPLFKRKGRGGGWDGEGLASASNILYCDMLLDICYVIICMSSYQPRG